MAGESTAQVDEQVEWISDEEEQATGSPTEGDGEAEGADDKAAEKNEDESADEADTKDEKDGDKADDEEKTDDYKTKYTELEGRYSSLEKHKGDLDRAIHGLRQEIKKLKTDKKGEDEVEFTDAQLLQILKEHPGDENMQLQVMKQLQKQGGKKIEKSAADLADIKQKQSAQQSWMQQNLPAEIMAEGSQFQQDIERTKEMLKLDDNPYGDFVAAGVVAMMSMPAIIKAETEKVSKSSVKEKVEEKRKEKIKDTKPKSGEDAKGRGKDDERKPTANEMDTIKNIFGPKPTPAQIKRYLSMRGPAK